MASGSGGGIVCGGVLCVVREEQKPGLRGWRRAAPQQIVRRYKLGINYLSFVAHHRTQGAPLMLLLIHIS